MSFLILIVVKYKMQVPIEILLVSSLKAEMENTVSQSTKYRLQEDDVVHSNTLQDANLVI